MRQSIERCSNLMIALPFRFRVPRFVLARARYSPVRGCHLLRVWLSSVQVRKIVSSLANPARDLLVSPLLVHGAHCRDVIAVGRMDKQRDGAIRTGWCQRTVVLTRTALL